MAEANLTPEKLPKFMARVEMLTESGCWVWMGSLDRNGYPNGAHRSAYRYFKGPIPVELELDHLCRVRCCVNPEHLEAVDHKTNCLRGKTLAALHSVKTHCPQGHSYEGDNVYIRRRKGQVGRVCKACWALHRAKAQADPKRKAELAEYWFHYQRRRRAKINAERAAQNGWEIRPPRTGGG